jgi:hypothetical protein
VAGDGFGNDAYQWMAAQRLFQRIAAGQSLKQDPKLAQFFISQSSLLLGDLSNIQHRISEITQGSDLDQKEFGKLTEKINELGDAITIWSDAPDGEERTQNLAELNAELDWTIRSVNGYEKYAQDQRLGQANALAVKMQSLEGHSAYEQNEIKVNHLLLTYHLWSEDLTDVPEKAWEELKSIAEQCPYTGGWPVYWARSLYRQYASTVTWDIHEGCGPVVGNRTSAFGTDNKVEVYPNPASSELMILLQSEAAARFQLWNIHGQLLLEHTLLEGKNNLGLQHQPNGIFVYKVQLQDGTIESGKIVIVH